MFHSTVPSRKFVNLHSPSWYLARLVAIALLLAVTLMMVNCGSGGSAGGGTVSPPAPTSKAQFSLSQTTYSFSATTVGTTSSTNLVVTVSSTGNAALQVSSVTDTDPTDFPGKTNCVTAGSIAPGSSCNISVQFQPNTAGSLSSQVTLTTNAGTGTIALSGSGVAAQPVSLSVSPSSASLSTGGSQQFSATVTGSANTAVTWSVNGIAGGNSTVGTISAAGLYTAPSSAPNPNTVTVAATSAADQTKSATAQATINAAQALAITGVSSSSPTALTPLYVSTTGLNTSQPFTVMLSNTSGYSASLTPIRTESDGTVVLAMPLYIDPSTGDTNSLNASLTISQGSLTSSSVALSIQDIPHDSDYGTSLGQITEAFYDYLEISTGAMLNGLQSIQAMPGNSVETTTVQGHLSTQLMNAILARSDIDQIVLSTSAQVGAGTLPDGTPISFNSTSVEMMDRLIAMYLTAIQPEISSSAAAVETRRALSTSTRRAQVKTFIDVMSRIRRDTDPSDATSMQTGIVRPSGRHDITKAHVTAKSIGAILSDLPVLDLIGAGETISSAVRTDWTADSTVADRVIASEAGAFAGLGVVATIAGAPEFVAAAAAAGLVIGTIDIAHGIYELATDPTSTLTASNSGQNPSILTSLQTALQSKQGSLVLSSVGNLLSALDFKPANGVTSLGQGVANFLEQEGTQQGIEGAGLLNSTLQLFADFASNDKTTTQNAAGQLTIPFSLPTQGIASVSGNVSIPTTQGVAAPLSGIQLSSSGIVFNSMADPNGDYQFFVPLNVPFFTYASTDLTIVDPVSQTQLGSETIDLSNLTTTAPLQTPTLQGSACTNVDFDSDDPDCD